MGTDRHGLGGRHKGLSVTGLSKEGLKPVMDTGIEACERGKHQSKYKVTRKHAGFLCVY